MMEVSEPVLISYLATQILARANMLSQYILLFFRGNEKYW